MSRPSKAAEKRLRALESASALLDEAVDVCGVLAVRLRQALRHNPHLAGTLDPADEVLARIADSCEDAHILIKGMLAEDQERRRR